MYALLNTIETLVMVGDPDLNSGNRSEWISLISKCLPCKTVPKRLDCPEDARCLQHVAYCFEEFTLHSTLFQVSCAAESKRKRFLKFHAEDHRCIYSANMTVRMWTTTSEEVFIPDGEGDKKSCAFHSKSTHYNHLLSIPKSVAQSSITGTLEPLAVLEAQTPDSPKACSSIDELAEDLTSNEPASSQATYLTGPSIPATDAVPITTVEMASGTKTIPNQRVGDEAQSVDHGDQHSDPEETQPDYVSLVATKESENLSCDDSRVESLGLTSSGKARHQASVNDTAQQHVSYVAPIRESPRIPRRSPFLYMQVPKRDSKFFGREELLNSLQGILTPTSVPTNDSLAKLNFGTVITLHGAPGVGKSAIAVELTYRTQAVFDNVFWLRANSELHLAQSYHQAATSLGLVQDRGDHDHENSRHKFIDWLSTTRSKWLLVFDDADELQVLPDFMPRRRHGSIIVTSRQMSQVGLDIKDDQCLHNFQVDPFVVEDATDFIRTLAPYAFGAAGIAADASTLTAIARNCGYLPLTLRRVGTLINRLGSMKEAISMGGLEQLASCLLASGFSHPLVEGGLSSTSSALLNVITFLDPYCIDDAILLGARRHKDVPLREFPMKDDDYFDAKNELIAHALLTTGTNSNAIDMHRLTARALRATLDPDRFREGFQSACRLVEARWPSRRKMKNIMFGNWPEFDSLHSHVHELSNIFVEYDRKRSKGKDQQELSNDSYLNVLLLSTW